MGHHLTDLKDYLDAWPYDDENSIRFLTAIDGREFMQVRQPMGIEQYELEGRPDGKTYHGCQTALDYVEENILENEARGNSPLLTEENYQAIRQEGMLFYLRYLILFQAGHYHRVCKDTEHNLRLCSLLRKHGSEEQQFEVLQYEPYIIRIDGTARAMEEISHKSFHSAKEVLLQAKERIEKLRIIPTPFFESEKTRSLEQLNSLLDQLKEQTMTSKDRLKQELEKAIEEENYELAARIRDMINH